jgi:hypothetical protein
MIEDEVLSALASAGADYAIEWIDAGLHAHPEKLRARVQDALDQTADADRILLAFGHCGNMIDTLQTRDFELILPNVDDCVSLMLYPHRTGKETGVYYLTRGWVRNRADDLSGYTRMAARHGPKKAERLLRRLMDGYHTVSPIETGAYSPDAIEEEGRSFAALLDLKYESCPGSVLWLRELFSGGDLDESRFLRYGPHETVQAPSLGTR